MNYSGLYGISAVAFALVWTTGASHYLLAQVSDPRLPLATVHVEVCGPSGEKIPAPKIRLSSYNGERDVGRMEQGLAISDVPYGTYILSAWDTGGGAADREITVNTRDVWVRIGLAFHFGDHLWPGGDLGISGKIHPTPTGKDWWVRVEGVFLHASRESLVSRAGRFAVGGLDMGTYLVEVFEGGSLRHIETVEIDEKQPDTHITVSIPEEHGQR